MADFARSDNPAVQAQLDRLSLLSPGGDRLGLDRITRLLDRLRRPQDSLPPVFHIAGTNGKGSTCAFLRAALEASGRSVHMTEGLLLLTNDGEWKRRLELPSTAVVRQYRARAFGHVTQAQLDRLAEGITIEGIHYGSIIANLERRTSRNFWIELSLTEGKNREVRRVLAHLGLQVSRLIRTAYGPLTLAGLEPGDADEVRQADLDAFRASLK